MIHFHDTNLFIFFLRTLPGCSCREREEEFSSKFFSAQQDRWIMTRRYCAHRGMQLHAAFAVQGMLFVYTD